jgi:UDP-N-acetylmuramoylalanine--D-glutamate ligase
VIMGGKDKGADFAAVGRAIARKAKALVLVGEDASLIREGALKAGFDRITIAESMADAVAKASAVAEPGDVVVLTPGCASFDMFSSFEDRGNVFKDAVRALEEERSG